MDRPLIGIPMASLLALEGVQAPQPASSVVGHRYVQAVLEAGGMPWPLAADSSPQALQAIYPYLDGILFPGGADIRPALYGKAPHPALDRGDAPRDEMERTLAAWAWRDRMPVLGICRGMQMLNVSRGGSLVQDLGSARSRFLKHDYLPLSAFPRDRMVHLIRAVEGTRLHALLGGDPLAVNSIHHQAVDRVGTGLVVAAMATDGVVEAVEAPDRPFFLGVQWHPEEFPRHRTMRRLFQTLVDVARALRVGREEDVVLDILPAAS